jgi:hypothetical protein
VENGVCGDGWSKLPIIAELEAVILTMQVAFACAFM